MTLKKIALALLLSLLPPVAFAGVPQVSNTATVTADNQFTATGDGATTVVTAVAPAAAPAVPTLSSVGLTALAVLLAGFAVHRMRRPARRDA